jgi:hypothetical protein
MSINFPQRSTFKVSANKAKISEQQPSAASQERNYGTQDNPVTRQEMKAEPGQEAGSAIQVNKAGDTTDEAPPAPFAEYGKLGSLTHHHLNKLIHRQTQPVMWNVHGQPMQVVEVSADGQVICDHPTKEEKASVTLDDAAYEKLLGILV